MQQQRLPVRLKLGLVADERDGHVFHLHVEEIAEGGMAWIDGADCARPWLRAACSCGWKAQDEERFTIEENAYWKWLQHVNERGQDDHAAD